MSRNIRQRPSHRTTGRGRDFYHELGPCPKCGMTAGERKESVNAAGRYYIRCASCGYLVGAASDYRVATRRWNEQSRERWQ